MNRKLFKITFLKLLIVLSFIGQPTTFFLRLIDQVTKVFLLFLKQIVTQTIFLTEFILLTIIKVIKVFFLLIYRLRFSLLIILSALAFYRGEQYLSAVPGPRQLEASFLPKPLLIYDRNHRLLSGSFGGAYFCKLQEGDLPRSLTISNSGTEKIKLAYLTSQLLLRSGLGRDRELKKIITTLRLVKDFSPKEILTLYGNLIPISDTTIGLEAASQQYFGKEAKVLTAKETRQLFLLSQGKITLTPKSQVYQRAPMIVDYLKNLVIQKYGLNYFRKNGLIVFSTIDLVEQNRLQEQDLKNQLNDLSTPGSITDEATGAIIATVDKTALKPTKLITKIITLDKQSEENKLSLVSSIGGECVYGQKKN